MHYHAEDDCLKEPMDTGHWIFQINYGHTRLFVRFNGKQWLNTVRLFAETNKRFSQNWLGKLA